jgi:hypothetical protein
MDDIQDADLPDDNELECGYSYDHDTVETYRGEDGIGWECRRCGAEGWEPADVQPIASGGDLAASRDAISAAEFAEFDAAIRSCRED